MPAKVVQIAAGEAHVLLLTSEGNGDSRVFSVGNNEYGQLGLGDAFPRPDAGSRAWEVQTLSASARASGVACGGNVSMAVSQRGDVWTWGRNEDSGVLGHGALPVVSVPSPDVVANLRRKVRAVQIATSGWASFCISHLGALYSWGGGLCGVHGHGHHDNEPSAKAIRSLERTPVKQVATGCLHTLALGTHGEVLTWGRVGGAFGVEATLQLVPKMIDALLGVRVVQVAAGGEHSLALAETGEVYAWGAHGAGALGEINIDDVTQRYAQVHKSALQLAGGACEVACGRCHSACAEHRNAEVWLCGKCVQPSGHPASQHEGEQVSRLDGQVLSAPPGPPLKFTRLDLKRLRKKLNKVKSMMLFSSLKSAV